MALATQCPHCHTTFRVAHDQLKLRAGIVRCGQCRQVFNGIEHLLPPAGIPQTAQTAQTAQTPQTANTSAAPETSSDDVGGLILPGAMNHPASTPAQPAAGDAETGLQAGAEPEPATEQEDVLEELDYAALEGMTLIHFPPAEQPSEQDDRDPAAAPDAAPLSDQSTDPAEASDSLPCRAHISLQANVVQQAGSMLPETPASPPNPSPASGRGEQSESLRDFRLNEPLPADTRQAAAPSFEDDAQEPGFVTAARRQQHKERRARLLFGTGSAILALVILAQASYALRNQIAAHMPQAKPALLAICQALGCSIALPAQIDAITIESSELQAQPGAAGTLGLTLLLRNRSSTAQAWPNIELTLNDGNERAILRRVFTPRDFPVATADMAKGIAADTEQSIRLSFRLVQLKPSGYRIVLFYP